MAKNKTHEKSPDESEESQSRMTFGEHLEELRKRIVRALLGSIFGVGFCLYFYKQIVDLVARPYQIAAAAHGLTGAFNTNKPQEAFLTSITLAVQAGLVLSSPWIIHQLWQFVAAGLYPRERKIVYRYTAPSALLFLIGVAFFYFIVLPMTLNFFMTFTADTAGTRPTPNRLERILGVGPPSHSPQTPTPPATSTTAPATTATTTPATLPLAIPVLTADPPAPADGTALLFMDARDNHVKVRIGDKIFGLMVTEEGSLFTNTWRYDDYLSLVTFTALIFGLAFELPMVILILAQSGIVETQSFRNVRKYAYFTILIAAVIAAPSGDFMTLFFLFLPLVGLYEVGIIAAAFVTRHKTPESP